MTEATELACSVLKPLGLGSSLFFLSPRDCGPSETQIRGHLTTGFPFAYRVSQEGWGGLPVLCRNPEYVLSRPRQNIASYMTSTEVSCPYGPFGPCSQKSPALNTQQLVIRTFPRVGINRKPHSVNPSFLGLERPTKASSSVCHFTEEKTEAADSGLGREVRSEAETYLSTASVESYFRLNIRDAASDLGEHNV